VNEKRGERIREVTVSSSSANAPEGINIDATFDVAQVAEGISRENAWDGSRTVTFTGMGLTKRGGSGHLDEQDPS
jgi:hypothetical protein